MTYPGNPTLPADVQQRIRSTFEHTLGLAEKGSRQEAMLGCDFVLRMDPQFEPARRLQERLDGNAGPVPVDDLRRPAGATAAAAPAAAAWPDLDGLAGELPELPELPDLHGAGAAAASVAPTSAAVRAEFEEMLSARRFQELQNRAAQQRETVTGDLELQRIVSLAQERLEAAPYVSKFLLSAREALRGGNAVEAGRLIEKARSLDPTHPGIAELEGPSPATSAARAATPAMAGAAGAAPPARRAPTAPQAPLTPLATVGDAESEGRIRQLLDAGQAALDGGDPQAAIDAWSRIFLIDIDHQEAARRIEEARRFKAERDRQVEETLHDGITALETHDLGAARGAFEHVLELQPGHLKAREYLQQIADGTAPTGPRAASVRPPTGGMAGAGAGLAAPIGVAGGAAAAMAGAAGAAGAVVSGGTGGGSFETAPAEDLGLEADLQEEILVPPDIEKAAARGERHEVRSASVGDHEGRARRLFVVVGGCVLFLVLAVGWFLYQKREAWFPNSRTEEPAQAPAPNPIPRATKLHNSGKVAIALTQLRRIAPGDPHYKEAQALIAKWQDEEAAQGAAADAAMTSGALGVATASLGGTSAAGPGGGPAGAPGASLSPDAERRASLIAKARTAFQDDRFLRAAESFGAADKLGKLDAADATQFTSAKQRLLPLQREVAMFAGHDWEYALPVLWKDHQTDPSNKDVTEMIVDSFYDLGVRDLQHGEVAKAADKFTEAQHLAPEDPDIERQLLFTQAYQGREADLLYHIYVKYLPIR